MDRTDVFSPVAELYEAITLIANDSTDVEPALRGGLTAVCEAVGWPVGHAFVAVDGRLETTDEWHVADPQRYAPFVAATRSVSLPLDAEPGPLRRTVLDGTPAWIADVTDDPHFQRASAATAVGLRGALAFPVVIGTEVVAVVEFFSTDSAAPGRGLLDAMRYVGIQLGRVFERRRVRELERRTMEAERHYLRIAAHELRGPLATLAASLQLLEDGDGLEADDARLVLAHAAAGVRRLGTIANNFLVEARLHGGAIHPRLRSVAVHEVVEEAVLDLPTANGEVEVRCDGDLLVLADTFLLQQVLSNLLGNACRYGRPPVVVDASGDGATVRIVVSDEGPGVPPDFVPRLFERFSRVSDDTRGSGVGLEVVQELTRLQAGTVRYESGPSGGARFVIEMPAGPPG